jgi:two-component system sensor histidine kinase UhpB
MKKAARPPRAAKTTKRGAKTRLEITPGTGASTDPVAHLERRLRALSLGLIGAEERERHAIARELHDHYGQSLTAVVLELDAAGAELCSGELAQRLQALAAELRTLLADMRDLTLRLKPPLIDEVGLEPALRWLGQRAARAARIEVEFELDPGADRLDAAFELGAFRIAQEACTNVLRHARASRLRIVLARGADALEVAVSDDGVGFEPASRTAATGGRGLAGMHERAELFGWRCEIASAPGRGTRVSVLIPLSRRS